jgi:endonuclease YncB( thermonuclease family)
MKPLLVALVAFVVLLTACTDGDTTESTVTDSEPEAVPETTTTQATLPPDDTERAVVEGVLDGDSLRVILNGGSEEIRLLGINAPERDECFAEEARSTLTNLVAGVEVAMLAGEEDRDRNGRLLRYVYIEGTAGPTLVNETLLRDGFAVAIQDGHELQAEFKDLENRSYASGIGMWATFACGQPEGGAPDRPQLRVADVSYDPAGDDTGSLDDEWVEIVNESYGTVNMSGWTVRDESSSNRFVLPSTSVNPGNTLRIVTGCGTDGGGILHWCSDTPVWNNDGDTVILQDELGNTVDHWPYAGP